MEIFEKKKLNKKGFQLDLSNLEGLFLQVAK